MANKTIWDLLLEPLKATIFVKTNQDYQPLNLVCPTRDDMEQLNKDLPEPVPPVKEIETVEKGKKKKIKEVDNEDPEYKKAQDDREVQFGLRLIDLGLEDKPEGDLDTRLATYKKLSNPVLQQIITSIQYLMIHEIPPNGKPNENVTEE